MHGVMSLDEQDYERFTGLPFIRAWRGRRHTGICWGQDAPAVGSLPVGQWRWRW